MTKKHLFIGLAVLVVAAVAAVMLDPTHVLRGYLKGEPFYHGRPASYWRSALEARDPAVEAETVRTLKEGGPAAVPVLVALLDVKATGPWESRWKVANLLGQTGPQPEAVAALIAALKDDDPHVRTVAAESLGAIAPKGSAQDAVSGLIPLVAPGEPAAAKAVRALSRFGPAAQPAIPALVGALKDKDSKVRWEAARTLGKMKAAGKEAVPALVAAMKDEDAEVREHAAEALGDIGPEAKDGVPGLVGALKDPVARVRRDASWALGQIGPAARPALPELQRLAQDEDREVRDYAARTVRILSTEAKKGTAP